MSDYIGQENAQPVVLNKLKQLLPNVSFPKVAITDASLYPAQLSAAGYETVTITNASSDVTPAWNQRVVLSNATRVLGSLQASYVATNMTTSEAETELTLRKEVAQSQVEANADVIVAEPEDYQSGTDSSDPVVSLRPDADTVSNLLDLLQVHENSGTGTSIIDSNGSGVALTLDQLRYLVASVVVTNSNLVADKQVARAGIIFATTGTAIDAVITTWETEQPLPTS
jgi:hypothetical protein